MDGHYRDYGNSCSADSGMCTHAKRNSPLAHCTALCRQPCSDSDPSATHAQSRSSSAGFQFPPQQQQHLGPSLLPYRIGMYETDPRRFAHVESERQRRSGLNTAGACLSFYVTWICPRLFFFTWLPASIFSVFVRYLGNAIVDDNVIIIVS
jgi:hypothetical protein